MQNAFGSSTQKQLIHRIQMRTVCDKLGRRNFVSRQVMRRTAIHMLKDARRDPMRTTESHQESLKDNKAFLNMVRESASEMYHDSMFGKLLASKIDSKSVPFAIERGMTDMVDAVEEKVIGLDTPSAPRAIANAALNMMTVAELIEHARGAGLKVTTKMTKAKLIEVIQAG